MVVCYIIYGIFHVFHWFMLHIKYARISQLALTTLWEDHDCFCIEKVTFHLNFGNSLKKILILCHSHCFIYLFILCWMNEFCLSGDEKYSGMEIKNIISYFALECINVLLLLLFIIIQGCVIRLFFVQMGLFLLTLNAIDILCLISSYRIFCAN